MISTLFPIGKRDNSKQKTWTEKEKSDVYSELENYVKEGKV